MSQTYAPYVKRVADRLERKLRATFALDLEEGDLVVDRHDDGTIAVRDPAASFVVGFDFAAVTVEGKAECIVSVSLAHREEDMADWGELDRSIDLMRTVQRFVQRIVRRVDDLVITR